jgi:alkane 1-monooxygenase
MPMILWLTPTLLIGLGALSLAIGGLWTFTLPLVSFGLIPILDQLHPGSEDNPSEAEQAARLRDWRYDAAVFVTIPAHFALLAQYLLGVAAGAWSGASLVGATFTMGIACGVYGINVAHELGHRQDRRYHLLSQLLLLSTLYMHFFIEHNRGHHRRVATPDDPASARRGEGLYAFWLRSVVGSWRGAWTLEADRLRHAGRSPWSWDNQLLRFELVQLVAVIAVGALLGPAALGGWLAASLTGILLLESVNYLEHYGLHRATTERGTWERVQPRHSWNSNRAAGRLLLFDLTRHADHHAHATRPYPLLRHHPEAPELPAGYPAMILLALAPPLFRVVMDRQLDRLTPTAG